MSEIRCRSCDAITDAFLCQRCADCRQPADKRCGACMVDLLAELPAGIEDLRIAAARHGRVGNPPQIRPDEQVEAAQIESRTIPARLRSLYGVSALTSSVMPVSLGAAALRSQAVTAVLTWARHIAESRGVDLPAAEPARRVQEHSTVTDDRGELIEVCTWTWKRPPVTVGALCSWLIENVDSIRLDEAAGEMHVNAGDLAAAIAAMIDRRDPEIFAGPCTATDVRIIPTLPVGAPCSGLTCGHESCVTIRAGVALLTSVIVECGAPLITTEGETSVTCDSCGTVYEVAERAAYMADRMADQLGTVREAAGVLRSLTIDIDGRTEQLEITVDRINGWLSRGGIVSYGADANGHRRVKFGEVREYAENRQRRRAARRAVRMAS